MKLRHAAAILLAALPMSAGAGLTIYGSPENSPTVRYDDFYSLCADGPAGMLAGNGMANCVVTRFDNNVDQGGRVIRWGVNGASEVNQPPAVRRFTIRTQIPRHRF